MKNLFLLLIFLSSFVFAQKVQIKKDKVLIDDREMAIVKSPYNDHYDFYDLKNQKMFEVDLKGVDLAKEQYMHYLELKYNDGKMTQIPYEVLVTSLKVDRIIAHQLAVKYHLFNQNGIDQVKLTEFFNEPRENLTDKYNQIKANSFADESGRQERLSNIKTHYNPRLGKGGEILFNNGNYPAKIAGYAKAYNCDRMSQSPCMEIWDLDNIKIAAMYPGNQGIRSYFVRTYDGNQFTFDINRTYAASDYVFVTELVAQLILEGYTLEHQAYYKDLELQNAKIQDAVTRSINLYDAPGYVIEKNGKRTEGFLTVWFEQLDVNRTGQRLPTEFADRYGQDVMLKTPLPANSMKTKTYNADSGVQFCVKYDDGTEDCYYGMSVKGELMKKLQNFGDMYGNNAYFYRLIKKEKGIMLLQDPVELHKYVIKTDSQTKGQMLDDRSNEKLSEKLAEYLSDCNKISEEVKSESLDLRNEENQLYIMKEYAKCKN